MLQCSAFYHMHVFVDILRCLVQTKTQRFLRMIVSSGSSLTLLSFWLLPSVGSFVPDDGTFVLDAFPDEAGIWTQTCIEGGVFILAFCTNIPLLCQFDSVFILQQFVLLVGKYSSVTVATACKSSYFNCNSVASFIYQWYERTDTNTFYM